MEPIHIFPTWARVLMPMAWLWLELSGIAWLVVVVREMADGNVGMLPFAGLGLFHVYLAWRTLPAIRSMRFRARLSGRDMHYRRETSAPVEVVALDQLTVTTDEAVQLISVLVAEPRQHLYTVDNSTSFGARLARRIVELQDVGKA